MLLGDLLTLRHFNFPVNIVRFYDRLFASRLGEYISSVCLDDKNL
jgi:hypothetical protein